MEPSFADPAAWNQNSSVSKAAISVINGNALPVYTGLGPEFSCFDDPFTFRNRSLAFIRVRLGFPRLRELTIMKEVTGMLCTEGRAVRLLLRIA